MDNGGVSWIGTAIRTVVSPKTAALVNLALVALMWVLELVDRLTGGWLENLGIRPRELTSIPEIVTAPFLHVSWQHLIANTVPFFVLGFLLLVSGWRTWVTTTLIVIAASGLAVWLLGAPGTVTVGASGVVFGWLVYLLVRGLFTRDLAQIVIGVVVFLVYGGLLWGLVPGSAFVSWQGHLGGALGGLLAAWWQHRRTPSSR